MFLYLRSRITADSNTQLAIKMFLLSFDVALSLILISNSLLKYESAHVHSMLIGFSFQHHCSLETVYISNIGRIMWQVGRQECLVWSAWWCLVGCVCIMSSEWSTCPQKKYYDLNYMLLWLIFCIAIVTIHLWLHGYVCTRSCQYWDMLKW